MPIPDLTAHGLLPSGVYDATLDQIATHFCKNGHRQDLWRDARRFLLHLVSLDMVYPIYIGGSFVTDQTMPQDVDMVLDLTSAMELHQFRATLMFHRERDAIKKSFRVDFCPNLPGNSDFSWYFQYIGEKTAIIKGLNAKDLKGVLRVRSWAGGLSR